MNFASDTAAPPHPAILEAMLAAAKGYAPSYGSDSWTSAARAALRDVFETDLDVWLVSSGTAANALALATLCPPHGSILCHAEAHIERDERGAPEFFTGGGKLSLLGGAHARIDLAELRTRLAANRHDFVHETPAHVLSLSNLTESGAAYRPFEIAERAALAREAGLAVHLDGARLANALVSTGATACGDDLAFRRGRLELRRHQEWRAWLRGHRAVRRRAQADRRPDGARQAGGTHAAEDALPRCADDGLSERRSLAATRAASQRFGNTACSGLNGGRRRTCASCRRQRSVRRTSGWPWTPP